MNPDFPSSGARAAGIARSDVKSAKRENTSDSDLPRVCFLIGRPRSGTTVFNKMLGTHPRVTCMGEIYNESNERSYFHFLKRRVVGNQDCLLPSNSTKMFMEYVRTCRRSAAAKKTNCKVVVLDVKYDQMHLLCEPWWKIGELPRMFSLLREQKWKVIDIHRNDIVRLCISNQIAMSTKIYHSTALAQGEKQEARIRVSPNRVLREIRTTQQTYETVQLHFANRREYKKIAYEDMFDTDQNFSAKMIDDISQFLGVRNYFDRVPKLQKLLSNDVLSHVENASELIEHLGSIEPRGLSGRREQSGQGN